MQISAVKSHADDAHWNYFSALLKTNCWYNCNLKNYTCMNGKRKVCPVDSRVQHAFRRLTRFMLAFIKTKGHKNESKLFKCLENAKTFLKVFLFWFLFIDLNVCVYLWQIKVNNSHLSISCILQLRINTLNHDKFLLYLELSKMKFNKYKHFHIYKQFWHSITSHKTLNIFHSFICY